MTQEVTRLERERQGLEQQIADLFAFYAKQKQAGKVSISTQVVQSPEYSPQPPHVPQPQAGTPVRAQTHVAAAHTSAPAVQPMLTVLPGALPSSQSVYRRPLPSPAPSPTRRVQ